VVSLTRDVAVETANQRTACLSFMPIGESDMARPKQTEPSLGLDRRQLLAATAVVTAVGIAAEAPHTANAVEAANAAKIPASDVPTLNPCASTAQD
jgi:hypothetical protein